MNLQIQFDIVMQQIKKKLLKMDKDYVEFSEIGRNEEPANPIIQQETKPSKYLELFIFADRIDIILMIIASVFSIANGVSIVFYSLPIGQLVGAFAGGKTTQEIVQAVLQAMVGFLVNSIVVFFNCWFMTAIWTVTSERQMITARKKYFLALLSQQQQWHDQNQPIQLCQKMYAQISKVHQSLITNVTSLLTKISMGCAGIIIALATGWKMALVMIAFIPAMMLSGFIRGHYEKKKEMYFQTKKIQNDSGVIEVFDNIKTVKMLNGENYQYERYHGIIKDEEKIMWNHGRKGSLAFSFFFFCIVMNYTLGFWYGSSLVSEKQINSNTGQVYGISEVIVIFFTLYISNLNLSGLPDNLAQFSMSRYSMGKILQILRRQPRVKFGNQEQPIELQAIKFKNISFKYDQPLFQSLNLTIREGITSLVGPSGCGKSTIISLLMRFYDPIQGSISLITPGKRSVQLKQFTEENLRRSIGYVGQEPVLIGKSIREALLAEQLTDQQIYRVLDQVNASRFTQEIGLDEPFTSLSGGQKQRIAICRALIRNPSILILDQSTSALDRKTQQFVLEKLKKTGIKFIIMIAHRIETISKSDTIIKIQNGKIVFQGDWKQYNKGKLLTQNNSQKKQEQKAQKQKNNPKALISNVPKNLLKQDELDSEVQPLQEEQKAEFHCNYINRLMQLNKDYWYLYVVGIIGAIYFGCIFPVFSLILSKIIIVLSKIPAADEKMIIEYQAQVDNFSLALLLISIGSLIFTTVRWLSFQFLTCRLSSKSKLSAFHKSINKQYIELEDEAGQYSHIIVKNCENMKQIAGNFMPTIIENLITLLAGICIAFAYSWAMTLVAFGILPLVLLASKAMMSFNHGMQSNTQERHKKNHILVVQSITNIKTVRSCALQQKLFMQFEHELDGIVKLSIKYGNLGGITFGIGQTLIFCMIAIIFLIGALLIRSGLIDIEDMYISVIAIMFAGVQAGGNLYFLSQLAPAKYGAAKYFELMEQQEILISEPDPEEDSNNIEDKLQDWNGSLKFENIDFKYQSRKEALFNKITFEVKKGEKVALVGQSGSGKSTIINLLFKLYKPLSGKILFDGIDSKFLSRKVLSNLLGIVMQEPVLFNRSVYENIKYNTIKVGINNIIKAAKEANAHEFILERKFGINKEETQIPLTNYEVDKNVFQAYMRNVGTKGSYLSGGQKQRVAIARSLVREPKILVLDQATSALDSQNQSLVQETLEKIKGMTQIIIAHRLSTIKNCDRIFVMHQGKIVENGKYQQLLKLNGWFKNLVTANNKDLK